jgi:hypothetical protein
MRGRWHVRAVQVPTSPEDSPCQRDRQSSRGSLTFALSPPHIDRRIRSLWSLPNLRRFDAMVTAHSRLQFGGSLRTKLTLYEAAHSPLNIARIRLLDFSNTNSIRRVTPSPVERKSNRNTILCEHTDTGIGKKMLGIHRRGS